MKKVLLFLLAIVILTLIGSLGYYFGFLGFIYNVMMPEAYGNFPLVTLSILFGVAAFFSPCTLTVLPSYVSHHLTDESKDTNVGKGIYLGLTAAVGVVLVNIILGIIIAILGSSAPFAKDPRQDIHLILGVRIVVGILIAYMGYLTVSGKSLTLPFLQELAVRKTSEKSMFLYGVLYNAAAIGCTGPILLGLMLYALSTGSFVSAFSSFAIFAFTMGVLMVMLTTAIAVFKGEILIKIMPFTPTINKAAGYTMIFVGLSIALLTLEGNRIFVKLFFQFLK